MLSTSTANGFSFISSNKDSFLVIRYKTTSLDLIQNFKYTCLVCVRKLDYVLSQHNLDSRDLKNNHTNELSSFFIKLLPSRISREKTEFLLLDARQMSQTAWQREVCCSARFNQGGVLHDCTFVISVSRVWLWGLFMCLEGFQFFSYWKALLIIPLFNTGNLWTAQFSILNLVLCEFIRGPDVLIFFGSFILNHFYLYLLLAELPDITRVNLGIVTTAITLWQHFRVHPTPSRGDQDFLGQAGSTV